MKQRRIRCLAAAAFVLLFLGAAWFTGCDLSLMWSRRDHLTDIAAKMFPPDWGFLGKVLPLLWATIQMSITGTFLGAVLSIPAAMACAATLAVQIPSPTGGYLNLGDAVVLLGAYLLGPGWGAAAGAVGPALADLMTYPTYVPATLLIKAVMGFAAGTLYSRLRTRGWGALVCGIVGEIPMVVGYWLYDALLVGSLAGSAAGVPANLVQAVFGVAVSTLLAAALRRSSYVRREFPRL